jgi:hypothetical protein
MTSAKGSFAALVIAVTLAGCKSGTATSSAAGSTGSPAAAGSATGAGPVAAGSAGGVQTMYIQDPSINNMNAVSVAIPAKWHFQGTLVQGDTCSPVPFAVYRATSPDGLTFVEGMPSPTWIFGSGPMATSAKQNGCLPLKQELSAQDFLKYYSETLNVQYQSDEPVPADVAAAVQKTFADAQAAYAPKYAAIGAQQPKQTVTLARASVLFQNGSFPMEGQLAATVNCTEQVFPGLKSTLRGMPDVQGSTVNRCSATVRYITTPQANYQATVKMIDAANTAPVPVPDWEQAWVARSNQQTAKAIQQINAQGAAARAASAQQFAHDQAVSSQMHQQFMSAMQTNFNNFEAGQAANSAARQQFTSDVVDFALDRQTVADPTTGQISKVSSSYSQTWVNQAANTSYQTNDTSANPNGILPGTWVQQTVTHGDGTPK